MATAFSDQNAMMSCLSNFYSFDADDTLVNDLIRDNSESPIFPCGNCDEGTAATSRCGDCNEYLCDSCVKAHLRVKLTKDHSILRITGTPIELSPFSKSSSSPIGTNNKYCDLHTSEKIQIYCESCCLAICSQCIIQFHGGHNVLYLDDAVETARNANLKLLADCTSGAQAVQEGLEMTRKMMEKVNARASQIRRDITVVMSKLKKELSEREAELILKVESIRTIKGKVLMKQAEGLQKTLNNLTCAADKLSEAYEIGSPIALLNAKVQASQELNNLSRTTVTLSLSPQEDDCITFIPGTGLLMAISSFGEINASSFESTPLPPIGEGFFPTRNRVSSVSSSLAPKSPLDDLTCSNGLDLFMSSTLFGSPENSILSSDIDESHKSRFYSYPLFNPDCSTNSQVGMPRNMLPIPYIPPTACVRNSNVNLGGSLLTFGKEGDGDGELCRPWGVCCDREGNIIVADRSNNRMQIFKSDGSFLHKFGEHGSEPGQFDRPAGVATNRSNDIIVADKDNHRIQIFRHDGTFKFTFGDKGSKTGQFNYPWDVDCNSDGQIVVSDTRNHRIQIFAADGSFISKYGFDSPTMWKHFDSPRGVCFGSNSVIVVTDFNNHRLVLIESNCRHARFLGAEGSGAKQFLRPQGVVVDRDGHIVVADSRNNRIQVFEQNGTFLWQFGSSGKEPGQLDRPSGICLTPDGKIVVVDFGNNRVQLF